MTIESAPGRIRRLGLRDRLLQILIGYGSLLVLVVLVIVFAASSPAGTFLSLANFRNIAAQSAPVGLVALAETITLIAGEFDLSVGYVCSLSGILFFGFMVNQHMAFAPALGLTLLAAAALGVVSGAIVSKLGINAFIGTLGVGIVAVGFNYAYGGGATVAGDVPNIVSQLGLGISAGLSNVSWVWLALAAGLWLFTEQTPYGIHLRAVGGNKDAARLAGVRVSRLKWLAFAASAVLAALGGCLLAMQLGSGEPTAGDGYLLDAFAASFLGTGFYRPGEFTVPGTIVGVLILQVGYNGLAVLGQPTSARYLFEGAILIFSLGIGAGARRVKIGR